MEPKENKCGYATSEQREVLLHLITLPVISGNFFLTGGTALAAFYISHRKSNDIDLFSTDPQDISQIDFKIKKKWPGEIVSINQSSHFLSLLFQNVKVDFVIDPVSKREKRPIVCFENGCSLQIDTLTNIISNKFCTLVSRTEPKDFVDFYFIFKKFPEIDRNVVFHDASLKDGVFDDPPSVAFQIETGLDFIKRNPDLFPEIISDFNREAFFLFYCKLVKWIYNQVIPGQ